VTSQAWRERFHLDDAFLREYEILGSLGKGAMGEVVKARQLAVGREVAIKFLIPQFFEDEYTIERFRDEAMIMARLNHPHIVQVITFRGDAKTPYLVLEYVDGHSLGRHLMTRGPLEVQHALKVLSGVLQALQMAHENKVIHRDLKSENVLIAKGGVAKLVDFGLAKLTEGRGDQTASGVILGTPEYMSPEQIRGEELDPRTDLYSLGVVLFEMLTGEVPFKNTAVSRTLLDHLELLPPRMADLDNSMPPEMDELVSRAMAKDRLQRFRNAEAMLLAVNGAHRSLERQRKLRVRADPDRVSKTMALKFRAGGAEHATRATRKPPEVAVPAASAPTPVSGGMKMIGALTAGLLLLGLLTLGYRSTIGARRDEGEVAGDTTSALAREAIERAGEKYWADAGLGTDAKVLLVEAIAEHVADPGAGAQARKALLEILESDSDPVVVGAAAAPLVARDEAKAIPPLVKVLPDQAIHREQRLKMLEALVGALPKNGEGTRFYQDVDSCDAIREEVAFVLKERIGGRYDSLERAQLLQVFSACANQKALQEAMVDYVVQGSRSAEKPVLTKIGRLSRDRRFETLKQKLMRRFLQPNSAEYVALPEEKLAALKDGMGWK
jgi:serine/threonine-protein kinase